jgi:lipoate-protein ligase B
MVVELGMVDYLEALEMQRRMAELRRRDECPDLLMLLEHPHTYTLGRSGSRKNVLLERPELERRDIRVYEVDRGGDVTYHGPGQLVGYPILRLRTQRVDYIRYIRDLEHALLDAIADLGIRGALKRGYTGIWVGEEKICAIGVKVDAWGVTSHGFALNVDPDMSYFGHIVPCGIADKGVTSIKRQLGEAPSTKDLVRAVSNRIARLFQLSPVAASSRQLEDLLAAGA